MARILVADDDPVVSHLLCSRLKQQGYEVQPAYDAMQALMFAMRAPHPDAVVLDINMPGGTGLSALKKLKASVKTSLIPVVVVSGNRDPGVVSSASEGGAAAFLPKPVDFPHLFEVLAGLLNG
jgi:CheY-like chemotaxis protein